MNIRFIGYAIVSDEGMLADAQGVIPPALIVKEDQAFFMRGLAAAAAIVHGRNSAEQPLAQTRRRLIATRRIAATAPAEQPSNSLLWNPGGAPVEAALAALGIVEGDVAIIGGAELFGLFLPHYDVFHLTRARGVSLPHGRPVFPGVPAESPEALLAGAGMSPEPEVILDADRRVGVVSWRRSA